MIKTVNFRTLGCRLNHAESDALQFGLQEAGYRIVDKKQTADLTVINSCAVTRQAEAKTRGAIAAARRISPRGKIAVIGCYPQLDPETVAVVNGVDLVLGNSEKYRLQEYLDELKQERCVIHVSGTLEQDTFPAAGVMAKGSLSRAHLKVQDGCDYRCAYCIVPFLRGPSRSRAFHACIHEAVSLVEQGFRELVLTGVNLGSYRDGENTLDDLVAALLQESRIERLRISSIEPDLVSERIIKMIAEEGRLCRYMHIPLQHGSDPVLQRMRRRYKVTQFVELVHKVTRAIPSVCIGSDVMVGFPGETEHQFQEMVNILEELPIAYLHVFRYSSRPGTAADRLEDTVTDRVKKERSVRLRELSRRKRHQFMQRFIGQEVAVLYEKKTKLGLYRGLSDNYITVNVKSDAQIVNRIKTTRITHVVGTEAFGELVEG
ncbi:MAG: tRNA (N(6)-L-threonylcarbamoyladenosine(37)-C(2))-methylthiotransferase MtaB [Fidelibacterota bacterium]